MENGEPRTRVRAWAAGIVLAVLILTLTAGLVARARANRSPLSDGAGTASWSSKSVALDEIPRRAQFRPLTPQALPADFHPVGAQMVWVDQDDLDLRLHPRQAIRFLYQGRGHDREMSITEAEHISSVEPRDNIWQVLSQGYFEPDHSMQSLLAVGTTSGTDFIIVSDGLSEQELAKTKTSLAPMDIDG